MLNNLGKAKLKDSISELKTSATRHFQCGADFKQLFQKAKRCGRNGWNQLLPTVSINSRQMQKCCWRTVFAGILRFAFVR